MIKRRNNKTKRKKVTTPEGTKCIDIASEKMDKSSGATHEEEDQHQKKLQTLP
jgi:hypothetical protein